jgi:hypothetical protein
VALPSVIKVRHPGVGPAPRQCHSLAEVSTLSPVRIVKMGSRPWLVAADARGIPDVALAIAAHATAGAEAWRGDDND